MPKINKVYPAFFNGVSQQNPELILDSQCKDMVNCVPDLVVGLTKRPPVIHTKTLTYASNPEMETSTIFHTYDRGEDDEEYIFMSSDVADHPLHVFHRDGTEMTVTYNPSTATTVKNYLLNGNLKGLTVQDRTWIFSKSAVIGLDYSATAPLSATYDRTAFYWLKRGSSDRYNPYNYAVYLNGVTYACNPNKPAGSETDPATGFEDSDHAANYLRGLIDGTAGFSCSVLGSILKIWRADGADFTFSTWDSWGNQASESWKGAVNKITDLPKDMPFDNVYVEIKGDQATNINSYYVKWAGSSWEECLDPAADRGQLSNMPIKIDRISLVGGIATFEANLIDWAVPRVGNLENNPNPSFAPTPTGITSTIQDMFFYKNRLGIASQDSVVLSETAGYTNFYVTSAIDLIDTDIIDITVATNQASKIYYAKPFNNSLYIFTKYAQYELINEGAFSPNTVSLSNASNYPMSIDVEPVVVNDSLYFISTTDNRQQLREYIKTDKLTVKGIDLNISTPTYMTVPVKSLVANGVLGYVLCCTDTNLVYLYNYKEDGEKRIQSAWNKWEVLNGLTVTAGSYQYHVIDSVVTIACKTTTGFRMHELQLDYNVPNQNVDKSSSDDSVIDLYTYEAKIILPDYYPQLGAVRTPLNKMLIKQVTISGEGNFDAEIYRKDYNKTYYKSHTSSMRDMNLNVASKVGNAVITIKDSSIDDFMISSVVVEGLFSTTSREMK